MPDEDNKVLKYVSGEKSLKVPFVIYADLECLLIKINTCQNNPDKSYTQKKAMLWSIIELFFSYMLLV